MSKPDEHFFFQMSKPDEHFFCQMRKPDEHFFSGEQTRWALFFQMSKPDEHYSSGEQGEMSTFLSDEQVKMSTLYFQMSTFYFWDEHLSTLWLVMLTSLLSATWVKISLGHFGTLAKSWLFLKQDFLYKREFSKKCWWFAVFEGGSLNRILLVADRMEVKTWQKKKTLTLLETWNMTAP